MARSSQSPVRAARRPERDAAPYLVVVRAPDGRTRTEQFQDPLAYRMRLATLNTSDTVSLDEIVNFLDN